MAGYDDTYQMIISTLMGRPVGTEIQPDSQQAYEINMLNYIRSLELIANGPLIGIAEANTQPIQPNDARACYIAGVAQDRTVTFQNFRNYLGQPIQITNGQMEACLVILIWDTQYWSATQVPTNIISAAEQANFYYSYNIRKTYPSVAAMNADKDNPIGTDGKYIKVGDIVTVVNSTTPSENGIYSYEGTTDGWKFQSGFNFQVEQSRSQNPNTAPSSKLLDDELVQLRSDLNGSNSNILDLQKAVGIEHQELVRIDAVKLIDWASGVVYADSTDLSTFGAVAASTTRKYAKFDCEIFAGKTLNFTHEIFNVILKTGLVFYSNKDIPSPSTAISGVVMGYNPSLEDIELETIQVTIPSNAKCFRATMYNDNITLFEAYIQELQNITTDGLLQDLNGAKEDIAELIISNNNILKNGVVNVVNHEHLNAFDGLYMSTVTSSVTIDITSTTAFSISQFKVEKGKTYHVEIPRTTDGVRYVWAFMRDEIISKPTAQTIYIGSCSNAIKGTSSPLSLDITNDTDYEYLIIGYNNLHGVPIVTHTDTYDSLIEQNKKIEESIAKLNSLSRGYTNTVCGVNGIRLSKTSMDNGDYIVALDYPSSNTLGECYSFRANITIFDKINIGRGNYGSSIDSNLFGSMYNCWLSIDNTNIKIYKNNNIQIGADIPHGLIISSFISINMRLGDDKKMYFRLTTLTGSFSTILADYYIDATGFVKVVSEGSMMYNCQLSAINTHFKSPLWIFGASFEEQNGWQIYTRAMGYTNYLCNAYPGRGSVNCFADFQRALTFGTPKYLYWVMWGNGTSIELDTYIGKVKELCEENDITLIIIDRPNSLASDVQSTYTLRKAVIDKYINLGVRFVNSSLALSTNYSDPNGWYSGFLNSVDGKHPTQLGYAALAMQVIIDIPEIMQY